MQSGGLRGWVGAFLPLSARRRGTRSCSLVLGPDTAGLQTGRVESIRVLLGCSHSLGSLTCAHAAGKGLPSPASLPALQAAPNLRKPRGGLGSGEGQQGQKQDTTKQSQSLPQPPARTPTPPYLVPGPPVAIARSGLG